MITILEALIFVPRLLWEIIEVFWKVGKGIYEAFPRHKADEDGAAWPTDRELKKAGFFTPGGFLAGVSQRSGRPVYLDSEASMIVWGARGAGKTQLTIANVKGIKRLVRKPDLIFSDPAGDIEGATREDLIAMGYGIVRLDLSDPEQGNRYNPLKFLDPTRKYDFDNDSQNLAELLAPKEPNSRYSHFPELAQEFLRGTIIHKVMTDQNATLGGIAELILTDKKGFEKELGVMQHSVHPLVRAGASAYLRVSADERGGFDSTLLRKLKPWMDAGVRHVTTLGPNDDHWTFEDVFAAEKPVAIFIRLGLGKTEFGGPFVRLVMGNAINTARRIWNDTGRPLPKGLWLMVDEAMTIGNCGAMVDAVNELRKVRVNALLCFHFMEDIEQTYDKPQSLLKGCAWVVNGGSRDWKLYGRVSEFAGKKKAVTRSKSKGDGRSSESEHETMTPMATVDRLERMTPEECVIVSRGILAKLDKPYSFTRKGPRYA
jgi:type IV secretory pathway TraG/TraD family ATPase VirD4